MGCVVSYRVAACGSALDVALVAVLLMPLVVATIVVAIVGAMVSDLAMIGLLRRCGAGDRDRHGGVGIGNAEALDFEPEGAFELENVGALVAGEERGG